MALKTGRGKSKRMRVSPSKKKRKDYYAVKPKSAVTGRCDGMDMAECDTGP